ncbi:ImmA/IrrE family metallo-endopeptidase [uncultured Ruthenibacterium sp.]|uniref:ImmA/IrrE family metallo-endopeptidase n=1 Tax=uncultured Ruthenibacterium sp. TaxID=1905347 RepID=UPI00349EC7C4
MLSKMYRDIRRRRIRLFCHSIGFTDAATLEMGGEYAIFLDFSKLGSVDQYQEALGHEIGHCATGCTHSVASPWDLVEKHEYKADRWAFEHYLPANELQSAIDAGLTEPWQLAEWYGFPESYVRKALEYWTKRRGVRFRTNE